MPVRVPGASRLGEGEARTFAYVEAGELREGFVLCTGGRLMAYRNRCPHLGVDLDMGTGAFFSAKLGRIYCHTHGATFEPATGRCDAGPCLGQALEPLGVRVEGEDAVVSESPGGVRNGCA